MMATATPVLSAIWAFRRVHPLADQAFRGREQRVLQLRIAGIDRRRRLGVEDVRRRDHFSGHDFRLRDGHHLADAAEEFLLKGLDLGLNGGVPAAGAVQVRQKFREHLVQHAEPGDELQPLLVRRRLAAQGGDAGGAILPIRSSVSGMVTTAVLTR